MKKPLMIIIALCLLLCISACGQTQESAESSAGSTAEKIDGTAKTTKANVVMTESYKQGRQRYYDATGIMLPEIADATMAKSSSFEEEYACFDITGTYDLYTEIVAFFTDHFGSAPETVKGDLEKSTWEFEHSGGGTDCYEVCWNAEGLIYINYWINS